MNAKVSNKFNNSVNVLPKNIPQLKHQFHVLGLSTILLLKSYLSILRFKVFKNQVIEQIVAIGFNTFPMIILMTTFSGMVLSLETADWLQEYGSREAVGRLVCLASIMEIAPIFVSFAIASQAGTAITAELAHMQITEQISALRLSKINPIDYLVSTRLCAAIYSLPIGIIAGSFFSIIGGMFIASINAHIEPSTFLDSVWRALTIEDIVNSIIKGFFFANYIIVVHTAFGLGTRGGAKEVGEMTSASTLWVTVGIVCINAILDYFMYIE